MKFDLESSEIIDEILPLADIHSREIGYRLTPEPLDINVDMYRAADKAGILRVFTIRDDGKLIGYGIFLLGYSLDRRTLKQAHEGGFFLLPEYRLGRIALKFLEYCDNRLSEDGVNMVIYQSPVGAAFGEILSRRGYTKVDEVYARRIECLQG